MTPRNKLQNARRKEKTAQVVRMLRCPKAAQSIPCQLQESRHRQSLIWGHALKQRFSSRQPCVHHTWHRDVRPSKYKDHGDGTPPSAAGSAGAVGGAKRASACSTSAVVA
eukprot:1161122-Pelagomonas_calceolata.AAC.11